MIINKIVKKGTPISGELVLTTGLPVMGICRQILIKPTTKTTTYDVKLNNDSPLDIYQRVSETGSLAEVTQIPLLGECTITISNATVDEEFIVELMTEE